MHLFITGGTGFIGSFLCPKLISDGHTLTILTRDKLKAEKNRLSNTTYIDSLQEIDKLDPINGIINLAGYPIADRRWSESTKRKIQDSRILLTKNLINALKNSSHNPKVFISGSAIGYYGTSIDKDFDEQNAVGKGFAAELCDEWEKAASVVKSLNCRLCIVRTGLVLGPRGGILKKMRLPFLFGLGGKMGSGQQWMSWIHIEDYLNIILLLLANETLEGIFNATAPNPSTNQDFTQAFAKSLKRFAVFPMPAFILRCIFGEMANELLLAGQKVHPKRLLESDFEFIYPELTQALLQIEQSKT